jgi:hypothetical protein
MAANGAANPSSLRAPSVWPFPPTNAAGSSTRWSGSSKVTFDTEVGSASFSSRHRDTLEHVVVDCAPPQPPPRPSSAGRNLVNSAGSLDSVTPGISDELEACLRRAAAYYNIGEREAAERELRAIAAHKGPAAAAALRAVSRSLRTASASGLSAAPAGQRAAPSPPGDRAPLRDAICKTPRPLATPY